MGYMSDLTERLIGNANKELAPKIEPPKPVIAGPPVRPANANPNGTAAERKAYSDWYDALQKYNKGKK